jgi:peptidoglycan/LPS O-acetylase OafA/YrhL
MLGYVRLLLALGVLFTHTKIMPTGTARAMVSGFFVVSGFLMFLTLSKNYARSAAPFYLHRIIRIYPLHITMCAVILIFFPVFVQERLQEYQAIAHVSLWQAAILSVLLVPNFAGFFNKPAWTLPFEVIFYALAPLIYRAGRIGLAMYGGGALVLFCILYDPVLLIYPFGYKYGGSLGLERYFSSAVLFSLGALLFLAKPNVPALARAIGSVPLQTAAVALLVLTLVLSLSFWPDAFVGAVDAASDIPINLLTVASVLLVLTGWDGTETPLSRLSGELCYPVYMIHFVFSDYLHDVKLYAGIEAKLARKLPFLAHPEFVVRSAMTLVLTILAGLLWLAIEKRTFNRLRRTPQKWSKADWSTVPANTSVQPAPAKP